MIKFADVLQDRINEKERVLRGYRLLKAVNPRNEAIIRDYVNKQDAFGKMVIENERKNEYGGASGKMTLEQAKKWLKEYNFYLKQSIGVYRNWDCDLWAVIAYDENTGNYHIEVNNKKPKRSTSE